jgi:hypothetical protein
LPALLRRRLCPAHPRHEGESQPSTKPRRKRPSLDGSASPSPWHSFADDHTPAQATSIEMLVTTSGRHAGYKGYKRSGCRRPLAQRRRLRGSIRLADRKVVGCVVSEGQKLREFSTNNSKHHQEHHHPSKNPHDPGSLRRHPEVTCPQAYTPAHNRKEELNKRRRLQCLAPVATSAWSVAFRTAGLRPSPSSSTGNPACAPSPTRRRLQCLAPVATSFSSVAVRTADLS